MKRLILLAIVLGVYSPIFSQWVDDFSDNEFLSNPEWGGNEGDFIVEGEILRLNAPSIASSSYLSTISNISLKATWRFSIKLDFNPSSSNYLKVFLMANTDNLGIVQNGYFIKIGGTDDEISLYKVIEGTEALLIDGADGRVGLSSVEVTIEVTRNASHLWELKTKLLGEPSFTLEGTEINGEIESSTFFGVFCKYTSSRSTKFFFDDFIVIGSEYIDPTPPKIIGYETPSNTKVVLPFDEELDTVEASISSKFLLNNTLTPTQVTALSIDTLLLEFSQEIALINSLSLMDIPDLVGNTLDTTLQIIFVSPEPYQFGDIILNELFPDPSPPEDLPAFEFVELLNNSDRVINLENWQFADGAKTAVLSKMLLFPDSFLIICPTEAESDYQLFGPTMGVDNWPTLNNSGDALSLYDGINLLVDSVSYLDDWYKNSEKIDGGWTLELINPNSKCTGSFNWTAATAQAGGTPGKQNSEKNKGVDSEPPRITQALLTDSLVELTLTEPTLPQFYEAYMLPASILTTFEVVTPSHYLTFLISKMDSAPFTSIKILVEDCQGNSAVATAPLINITQPKKNDIIINEVLFNPFPKGDDFIEVFNTTSYYFNLKEFSMDNGTVAKKITNTNLLLKPKHYLALSGNILFLKNQYLAPDSSLVIANLPSMPNEEGLIMLKTKQGKLLDSIYYYDKLHFSLITDTEGISLERISSSINILIEDNWRSAAESVGFASPGYKNSQSYSSFAKGKVSVSPQIITPNNDGQADFCQIAYTLDRQSQTISIAIYTINGHLIKTIANNTIISAQGFFIWDGTGLQGSVLPTAHYIIVSEVITSDGRVIRFRNKVVVANGF